jgi:hypothetical protein
MSRSSCSGPGKKYPEAKAKIISDKRSAVHRQGVHSDLRHDARPDFAVLPAIERKNRTLAQIAQEIHTEHDRKLEAASATAAGVAIRSRGKNEAA